MQDHSKTVSALSLDPSGARLVSGSYDYACKLWDFGGMNSSFKPFRSWEPRESHQVCRMFLFALRSPITRILMMFKPLRSGSDSSNCLVQHRRFLSSRHGFESTSVVRSRRGSDCRIHQRRYVHPGHEALLVGLFLDHQLSQYIPDAKNSSHRCLCSPVVTSPN